MRRQRENAPKFQTPSSKIRYRAAALVFEIWGFFGIWNWNLWLSSAPARRRPDWFTDGQCVSTSSKKANARGSFDWPSQNIASLRTSLFRLLRAA